MQVSAIDLFCGAGGLTNGLQKAGVKVQAGYDIEAKCKYAYEFNNNSIFVQKDITEVTKSEIETYFGNDIKLLAGCAPCQPFSTYNQGKDVTSDKKWPLLYQFARLIDEVQPELVTMENVPSVTKHKVYIDFIQSLESKGYNVHSCTVDCTQYGIPQSRKRHVVLASKLGHICLIEPTHKEKPITVKDTIKCLPPLKAGRQCKTDPLHKSSDLSPLNLKRIKVSKPGGTWRDWPEDLIADCHKKDSGKTFPGVYARMEWDQPSPTMTTQCYGFGNGRFGHPTQNRAISLREAALFQTFPIDYQFTPPDSPIELKSIGKMIGNAVPVRLGEVIGLSIKHHLESALTSQRATNTI